MKTGDRCVEDLRELYGMDYLAWYEKTLEIARSGSVEKLDLESLSEVLEDLVRDRKRSGRSFLKNIIVHLLLIQYWQLEGYYNYRHWSSEIANFRDELAIDMTNNLRKYLDYHLETIYQKTIRYTVLKTGIGKENFPDRCPYTLEQLLDENWFPEV